MKFVLQMKLKRKKSPADPRTKKKKEKEKLKLKSEQDTFLTYCIWEVTLNLTASNLKRNLKRVRVSSHSLVLAAGYGRKEL